MTQSRLQNINDKVIYLASYMIVDSDFF